MEIVVAFLSIVILGLIYLVYNSKNNSGSSANELIQFSNSLSSQIQEIRKEINANSKESRTEIESKLKDINKQINDFHKTSTSNITLTAWSYNPNIAGTMMVWAVPRSLAATKGITNCFLFLWLLRCFSSPGWPP